MAQNTYVPASPASSGASFSSLQADGLAGLIPLFVAANGQVTAPASQATVVANQTTTGGNLASGTYYLSYVYGDGFGLTTIGSSRSASFTVVTPGWIPRVTFNDTPPSNAVFRHVYLTATNGAAGTETLYATGIAKATTTFDLSFAGPTYPATSLEAIPAVNTTGAATVQPMLDALFNKNQAWVVVNKAKNLVDNFIQGSPVDWYFYLLELQRFDNIFASYRQIMADIMGLVVANPGSLHNVSTNVMPYQHRTFP